MSKDPNKQPQVRINTARAQPIPMPQKTAAANPKGMMPEDPKADRAERMAASMPAASVHKGLFRTKRTGSGKAPVLREEGLPTGGFVSDRWLERKLPRRMTAEAASADNTTGSRMMPAEYSPGPRRAPSKQMSMLTHAKNAANPSQRRVFCVAMRQSKNY